MLIIRLICSNNNTRLILSGKTLDSPILYQSTGGMLGLKGATRSSIYAAETLLKGIWKKIQEIKKNRGELGGKNIGPQIKILVKGLGPTRNYLLRKLGILKITQIKDITGYPHNGCRKKKRLRR